MAANTQPRFPKTAVIGSVSGIATNTSRADVSGTGTNTAATPTSAEGKRVDRIEIQLAATSAAALVFIWIYDGTTQRLKDEIYIPAVTPSNTVPAVHIEKSYTDFVLPASYRIFVSTTINQTTNVNVYGGDM